MDRRLELLPPRVRIRPVAAAVARCREAARRRITRLRPADTRRQASQHASIAVWSDAQLWRDHNAQLRSNRDAQLWSELLPIRASRRHRIMVPRRRRAMVPQRRRAMVPQRRLAMVPQRRRAMVPQRRRAMVPQRRLATVQAQRPIPGSRATPSRRPTTTPAYSSRHTAGSSACHRPSFGLERFPEQSCTARFQQQSTTVTGTFMVRPRPRGPIRSPLSSKHIGRYRRQRPAGPDQFLFAHQWFGLWHAGQFGDESGQFLSVRSDSGQFRFW